MTTEQRKSCTRRIQQIVQNWQETFVPKNLLGIVVSERQALENRSLIRLKGNCYKDLLCIEVGMGICIRCGYIKKLFTLDY